MRYQILGSGPAGIAAAREIRRVIREGEITILSGERDEPYIRSLLPLLITGEVEEGGISDPRGKELEEEGIELVTGVSAVKVEPESRTVSFSNGGKREYDSLLLATGGRTTLPDPLNIDSESVLRFDSLEDTRRIVKRAEGAKRALVYGPGYLGIVASGALRKRGMEVVWFRPKMPRHGYPIFGELEARFLDGLIHSGVELRKGADVEGVREEDGDLLVKDQTGEEIVCSMIVVATERVPSIGFLKGSGIKTGTGVIVDAYLRTSVPYIFAAGDCAELRIDRGDDILINFGWRSAIRQGQLAGGNMAGLKKRVMKDREEFLWQVLRSPKTGSGPSTSLRGSPAF